MTSPKTAWRWIFAISFSATLLFITGFILAMDSVLWPKSSMGLESREEPEEDRPDLTNMRLLALGDSLTKGEGDESGEGGYPGKVKNRLDELLGQPVAIANFAVNGYTSEQLLSDLNRSTGIMTAVQSYDIVLLTIGANDLFSPGEEVSLDQARLSIDESLMRMKSIFKRLIELNPENTIVYTGLYNPFSYMELDEDINLFIQKQWNFEVFQLASRFEQIIVVPTFDLFQLHPKAYLSSDMYHPNAAGYARIADRIVQVLDMQTGGGDVES